MLRLSVGTVRIPVISRLDTFMYHVDYDTTVGGLFVPDGIIRPEVSASALTWFIRYIYLLKFTVPK